MRLYATVTSERASKGQGGNERLYIDLFFEDRKNPVGYIRINKSPTLKGYIFSVKIADKKIEKVFYGTKGKK